MSEIVVKVDYTTTGGPTKIGTVDAGPPPVTFTLFMGRLHMNGPTINYIVEHVKSFTATEVAK